MYGPFSKCVKKSEKIKAPRVQDRWTRRQRVTDMQLVCGFRVRVEKEPLFEDTPVVLVHDLRLSPVSPESDVIEGNGEERSWVDI